MRDGANPGCVFESLEARLLLSGDVTATLSGGTLHVRGDVEGNEIAITETDPGTFTVTGTDTTVNGEASATFEGVTGNVIIRMGEGDDTVTVDAADIAGRMIIRLGGGDDTVTVTDSTVGKRLAVKGRGGDDSVSLEGVDVSGKLRLKMGKGDDGAAVTDCTVALSAVVRGGAGTDTWTYLNSDSGRLKVKGFDIENLNAPVFTSSATPSVPENTTAAGTVTAIDADGDTVTYSITGGADAAKFTINGTTGALAFLSAPDYETPTDANADNVYQVTVTADDGSFGLTEQDITVTITAVEDNDPVFTSSETPSVEENTTAVVTVTATDADLPAQTLTYSITGGDDAALFTIDGSTGELAFLSAPDYEAPADANTDNVYLVQVTADDGAGGTTAQDLSVTVTDVVEP